MTMKPILEIRNLHCGYGRETILKNISLTINAEDQWAVIGRNGTGKSTLIKCIAGLIPYSSDSIYINGTNIIEYDSIKRAQWLSYVPQSQGQSIPLSVYDYVMLGRYSNQGFLALPGLQDREIVEKSLAISNVNEFSQRLLDTLSGGEKQRVFLAGAVAQQAKIMLLDEPTTYLDPYHSSHFHTILTKIHATQNLTVVSVTHNINDALSHYSHILALKEGQVYFSGNQKEFLARSPTILKDLFGIPFQAISDKQTGRRVFFPLS